MYQGKHSLSDRLFNTIRKGGVISITVIKKVAETFGAEEVAIKEKGRKDNIARKVALYFIHRYSGLSNTEIGKIFGGIHFSTISKASFRLKEEMAEDKGLARLVRELDSSFKA